MQLLTGSAPDEGALGSCSTLFGDPPAPQLARYIAAIVFAAFVAKAVFTIVFRWWLSGFLAQQEAQTAISLLRRYLAAPYWLHLHRSSTSFVRTMNEGVSQTYSVVVIGVVSLISESLTVAALTTVLLARRPRARRGCNRLLHRHRFCLRPPGAISGRVSRPEFPGRRPGDVHHGLRDPVTGSRR